MKILSLRGFWLLGALSAFVLPSLHAQVIELRATINSAQETTGSTSTATGTAIVLYDVAANKCDVMVTLTNFTATLTASHIHEAALAVAGPVVTGFGAEAVYVRTGTTLTATFLGLAYGGTPLTLLQNGAYVNFHTAAFPGGEIRGQLISQPKRLVAVLNGANEAPTPTNSTAYAAAYITYDPGTNKITTRLNVYNFTNTFSNSHYHEGISTVAGPVVHGLGNATVYTRNGNFYGAVFTDQTYLGSPIKLLTGGTYLNIHSNVNGGGEIRGTVRTTDEINTARLINISSRGYVGSGEQALISGFVITGNDPVRVLVTAKGPSLSAAGIFNALGNPALAVYDSAGRLVSNNDDFAQGFSAADLPSIPYSPTNAREAALLLVLPPGIYTSVVTSASGATGIALSEVYEVRPPASSSIASSIALMRSQRPAPVLSSRSSVAQKKAPPELCISAPLAVVLARQ